MILCKNCIHCSPLDTLAGGICIIPLPFWAQETHENLSQVFNKTVNFRPQLNPDRDGANCAAFEEYPD